MSKFPNVPNKEDFDEYFRNEIWFDVAAEICRRERISFAELKRAASSDHIVFTVDERFVLKIYRFSRNCFAREMKALEFVGGKIDLRVPEIVRTGEIENFDYVLMTQLPGVSMTRPDWLKISEKQQLEFVSELAAGLKQIHKLSAESFSNDWTEFVKNRAETFIERQIAHGVNQQIIKVLPEFIKENLRLVPTDAPAVFMHGDVHFGNLRVSQTNGKWQVAGLFDFADSRVGFYEYDFLAVGVLMIQGQAKIQREFFKAYGYAESDLNEEMRRRLMMLTMLYETSDLRRYALRLKPAAVDYPLEELEKAIWSFVE